MSTMFRTFRRLAGATAAVTFAAGIVLAAPAHAVTTADVVNTAVAEVGTLEGSARADSYGAAVGRYDSTSGYSWCAAFVSWVMKQTGATTYRSAAVGDWVSKAKLGQYGLSVSSTPRAGDLVAFDWDGNADYSYPNRHIGIVRAVTSTTSFTTVEGNTSGTSGDGVYSKTRYTNSSYSTLFIRINIGTAMPASPTPVQSNPDGRTSLGWSVYRNSALEYHVDNGPLVGGRAFYGIPAGSYAITGDWDGDGRTSVGWALATNNGTNLEYHVDNGPLAGGRMWTGIPAGSYVITGDWDGDGKTSVGWAVYRNNALEYHVDNGPLAGGRTFSGIPSTSKLVTGDWDGDGKTSVGWAVYRNSALEYHVDNGPLAGGRAFYGIPSDSYVITGDWDGDLKYSFGWARFSNSNLEYHVDNGPLAGGRMFSSIPAGSVAITGSWDGV